MVIVGVVLLLPGLYASVFGASSLFSSSYDSGFTLFILFGLLVGFGGVMTIRAALRGQRR
ncbi:MAG TPA: mercuric transport protein [Bradyrhizobium sp.]|nr:mercuric transport protein [Bradyrhizobium sp.]